MTQPLLTRLATGPLLLDGACGTMLYSAGVPLDSCFDEINLTRPDVVACVHRAYIGAGADVIETNTFGANRSKLDQFGLGGKVREINQRAVRIAREEREISGVTVLIAGSVGPTLKAMTPIGSTSRVEISGVFAEQIEALLVGGVDLLIIETIGGLEEMGAALEAATAACDLPIVASMTFAEDGRTISGNSPAEVVDALEPFGIVALGANCSVGPQRIIPIVRGMQRHLAKRDTASAPWLVCMPNAGWPAHVGGRVIYRSSPEYFAEFAQSAIEAGARIIGGCCGTTPAHTQAMRAVLDSYRDVAAQNGHHPSSDSRVHEDIPVARSSSPTVMFTPPAVELIAADGPTELAQKLGRKFIVSVEIDPPKGLNPAKALSGAQMLKDVGVDAINVADSPMARVRMSAMTLCYLIQHQVGIETILHFTTRDRSLMGLQSELLGAHAVGVRNILALTGDPPSLGDYPDSSAVYDVDSIGLVRVIDQLNAGIDSAGASIGRPASFTIACAVDPTRPDMAEEARRLRAKLTAGADFIMTQPIYDLDVWRQFLTVLDMRIDVPVILGILPLQSHKHAEFLHNEVPGITLSDAARERMRLAGSDGRREGVRMAQELLAEARPIVQGVYLMPSFGRYEVAAEVLEILGTPAPQEA